MLDLKRFETGKSERRHMHEMLPQHPYPNTIRCSEYSAGVPCTFLIYSTAIWLRLLLWTADNVHLLIAAGQDYRFTFIHGHTIWNFPFGIFISNFWLTGIYDAFTRKRMRHVFKDAIELTEYTESYVTVKEYVIVKSHLHLLPRKASFEKNCYQLCFKNRIETLGF